MPKQIRIKKTRNRGFTTMNIDVTSTGVLGYERAMQKYVSNEGLREPLEKARERIKNAVLERFLKTKGFSRYIS